MASSQLCMIMLELPLLTHTPTLTPHGNHSPSLRQGIYPCTLIPIRHDHCPSQAGVSFPDLGKAKAAVGRVFPLLDRVPAINAAAGEGEAPPPSSLTGELEFRHIKFA
jgi:hypothetical protein